MKFLLEEKLDLFLSEVAKNYKLYVPVEREAGKSSYKEWKNGVRVSKNLNTTRSAKDFFFPQSENLVDFKLNGKNIEIIDNRSESEDFAVFGVRACDARSFEILDKVFLAEPVDSYYKNRRSHGLVISVACSRPAETCFCKAFGIDASAPFGDVVLTPAENGYFIYAGTDKGEKLLSSASDVLCDGSEEDAKAARDNIKAIIDKLPLSNLDTSKFGGGKTKEFFDSPKWKSLSEACLGCGTCTFVCPTCQCYDIKDFDTGHGIKRFRCWDSCMYSDFTKMAHGNPRLTQRERFRQRFMHKLVYFPENNDGVFGCVGCGRCLRSCPISMNIVKVMKELSKEEN